MQKTRVIMPALTVLIIVAFSFFQHLLPAPPGVAVYGTAAAGMILSLQFNKSKAFLLTSLLLIWFISHKTPDFFNVPLEIMMLFVTANSIYIIFSADRGIINIHGLKKVSAIIAQVLVYLFLEWIDPQLIEEILENEIFQETTLSVPAFLLLISGIIIIMLFYNIYKKRDVSSTTVLSCLLAFNLICLFQEELLNLTFLISFGLICISIIFSMYSMSYIDELTSLPGRRAFNEHTAALGKKYTLAMADIDNFKKINDKYGHDTGDEVLKFVASVLASPGSGGKAFRLGGEEFVIVFNGKSKNEVFNNLENLRKKIQNKSFVIRNWKNRRKYEKTGIKTKNENQKTIKFTISFGVSDTNSADTVEKVIKNADKALYKAKKKGKNQICSN